MVKFWPIVIWTGACSWVYCTYLRAQNCVLQVAEEKFLASPSHHEIDRSLVGWLGDRRRLQLHWKFRLYNCNLLVTMNAITLQLSFFSLIFTTTISPTYLFLKSKHRCWCLNNAQLAGRRRKKRHIPGGTSRWHLPVEPPWNLHGTSWSAGSLQWHRTNRLVEAELKKDQGHHWSLSADPCGSAEDGLRMCP